MKTIKECLGKRRLYCDGATGSFYCGLDCEACEARIATVNNDEALCQRVAREWSELNGVEDALRTRKEKD